MSELDLIRQYDLRRSSAFDKWLLQPSTAPSPTNPQPTSGQEQLGPNAPPPKGHWASFVDALKAGASATYETAKQGAGYVALADRPVQAVGGAAFLAAALPAGAGAVVHQLMRDYKPELESTPISQQGIAKTLRALLMVPNILTMTTGTEVGGAPDIDALAANLDEPMTWGEAVNIGAMLLAGGAMGKAVTTKRSGRLQGVPDAGTTPFGPPSPPKALPPHGGFSLVDQPIPQGPIPFRADPVGRFNRMVKDTEFRQLADELRSRAPGQVRGALPAARDERTFLREQNRTPLDAPARVIDMSPDGEGGFALAPGAAAEISRATEANGGASYSPARGAMAQPGQGFAVAVAPERGVVVEGVASPEVIQKFAADNADLLADDRMHVGTWLNEGKTHLDISAILPDRNAAMQLAKEKKQKAIFDFSTMEDVPVPKTIKLEHYSRQEGLKEVDPEFFGSGQAGREMRRADDPGFAKRSYFYEEGATPEARFAGHHKYSAEIDADRIYDIVADPKGFTDNLGGDYTGLETRIREAGFSGYRNQDKFAVFDKLPVTSVTERGVMPPEGQVRLYRRGEGSVFSTDPSTAPGNGPYRYADAPVESLAGHELGQGYVFLPDGAEPKPYFGKLAEAEAPKIEAAKRRILDAFGRALRDESGKVQLRGEVTVFKPDTQLMNDLAAVGAAVLWKGARSLKDFTREMVAEVGEKVAPHVKDIYPKAQKALEKMVGQAEYGLPSFKKLLELYHEGEYGKEWYDLAKVELQDMFGIHAELYAQVVAATSPNSNVAGNVTRANNAMKLILSGERRADGALFTEADGLMASHVKNLNRILRGEELSGPKVGAFARAIMGDRNAVVLDTWMARALGLTDAAVLDKFDFGSNPKMLRFVTKLINDIAEQTGSDPRQVQAAIWVAKKTRDEGGGLEVGRPLHDIVREKLAVDKDLVELLNLDKDTWKRNEDLRMPWDEAGRAEVGSLLILARGVIGAVAGAMLGQSPEAAAFGTLVGLGIGSQPARAVAGAIVKRLKSVDPDGGKLTTFSMGIDPTKLGDVLKNVVKRRTTERDFNYARMDASTQAKNLIRTIDTQLEKLKQFRSRSHAETRALSAQSKYQSLDELLKLPDDTPLSGPDYLAAREVLNHVAEEAIREAFGDGDAAKVRQLLGVLGETADRVKEVRTSIARAEESGRIVARESDLSKLYDVDRIVKGVTEAQAGFAHLGDAELIQAVKGMADASKLTALARHTKHAPGAFWEIYYGLNLMSSPITHLRNFIGDASAVVFGVADRAAGELIAVPFHLTGRGKNLVQLGETSDIARAMASSFRGAFRAAKDNWATGESLFGAGKRAEAMETAGGMRAANFGIDPASFHGKVIDTLGAFARGNLRFLDSVDEFFKVINFGGELAAQARRTARAEGHTGKALHDRMNELHERPTPEMLRAAQQFAKEQTFSKEFAPETYGAKIEAAAKHPVSRIMLTPFFRTPMRLAEYSNVHTPGLNLLAKQFWSDIGPSSTPAKRNLAFGKLAVGGAIVYSILDFAANGYITGDPPRDPALRQHMENAGVMWRAIYSPYNGKYYSYDNLEPVSTMFAAVANYARLSAEMPDHGVMDNFSALTLAMANSAVAKQWWKPVSDLLDAVEAYGRGADEAGTALMRYAAGRLSALTPGSALLRAARRATDEQVREPGRKVEVDDPLWAEVRRLAEYWMDGIPGLSKHIPARKNIITGEPIVHEGIFGDEAYSLGLAPVRVSTNKNDVVLNEIVNQQGAGIPREVPRVIGGAAPPAGRRLSTPRSSEGVLLNEQQRARLATLITTGKDPYGLTLHQALTSLVTESGPYAVFQYKSESEGKDGGKGLAIHSVWHQFYVEAEEKLLEEDRALADQVRRRRIERELGKLPPAMQETIRPVMGVR